MKIVIKHDIDNDAMIILNVFTCDHSKTKAIESIMHDIVHDDYQVIVKKNEVFVYLKGLLYGKTLKYRYIIDDFFKMDYAKVLTDIDNVETDEE